MPSSGSASSRARWAAAVTRSAPSEVIRESPAATSASQIPAACSIACRWPGWTMPARSSPSGQAQARSCAANSRTSARSRQARSATSPWLPLTSMPAKPPPATATISGDSGQPMPTEPGPVRIVVGEVAASRAARRTAAMPAARLTLAGSRASSSATTSGSSAGAAAGESAGTVRAHRQAATMWAHTPAAGQLQEAARGPPGRSVIRASGGPG